MDAVALTRLFDYEVSRSAITSPEQSLRIALARSERRNYAKSIFFCWPNLEEASKKLAGLMTQHFPNASGDGYLLDETLSAAVDLYEETVEVEEFARRMAFFLKTLLDRSSESIVLWETHGFLPSGDTVAWQVGMLPLQEWVKKKNIDRIVFSRRKDVPRDEEREAARMALSSSVMKYNDLVHIARLRG